VIASLWNVDDEATAFLMERFYIYLKADMGKGEALRQAQMDTREQYPSPYYWAAFVLTGDPGEIAGDKSVEIIDTKNPTQIPNSSPTRSSTCAVGLIIILMIFTIVWLFKKHMVV